MSPHTNPPPLYILACDHRASFRRALFGDATLTPDILARTQDVKHLVADGLAWAVAQGVARSSAGLLMDTETGSDALAVVKSWSIRIAIPVERGGGGAIFEFDHGPAYREHVEGVDPDYVKALVHYNPQGDEQANALQRERLGELSRWLADTGRRLLLELLVPATAAQLAVVDENLRRYEQEVRPDLTVKAIAALQRAGVRPDVWKLEAFEDVAHFERVARQCRVEPVADEISCIVLGRGADLDQVRRWLTVAAEVPGYHGFAVGRSVWMAPLIEYVKGRAGRQTTVERIGGHYLELTHTFHRARTAALGPR